MKVAIILLWTKLILSLLIFRPPDPPQGGGQVIHHQNINLANSVPGIPGAGFPGMTSSALSYHQIDSRNSPNSQFIWPPQYVTTSTPVTNSSQSSNSSPLRNPAIFQNHAGPHNIVGLPVTSTQYKSPYAVPQSSSGSSASATFKDPVYKQQLPVSMNSLALNVIPKASRMLIFLILAASPIH